MREFISAVDNLFEANRGDPLPTFRTSLEFYQRMPSIPWKPVGEMQFRISVGDTFEFYREGTFFSGQPEATEAGILRRGSAASEVGGMAALTEYVMDLGIAMSNSTSETPAARKFWFKYLNSHPWIMVKIKGQEIVEERPGPKFSSYEKFEEALYDDPEHDVRFVCWSEGNHPPNKSAINQLRQIDKNK